MAKKANPGELRTPVYFKHINRVYDSGGFPSEEIIDLFGGAPMMCKWVNTHGNEVWEAMRLQLRDPATITTRYSPLLDDISLILHRGDDPQPYEVISVDNVEQRNEWLEIKVQRKAAGR